MKTALTCWFVRFDRSDAHPMFQRSMIALKMSYNNKIAINRFKNLLITNYFTILLLFF